jgi:hypothetical protein
MIMLGRVRGGCGGRMGWEGEVGDPETQGEQAGHKGPQRLIKKKKVCTCETALVFSLKFTGGVGSPSP